jgi:hypothetical protein
MDINDQFTERRKHRRFKTKENSYIAISPHYNRIGRVIDISLEGVSFRHLDLDVRPVGTSQLCHIYTDDGFHIHPITVSIVSELMIIVNMTELTESRLNFKELSKEQSAKIRCFIDKYSFTDSEF